jgi:hypothetical protein
LWSHRGREAEREAGAALPCLAWGRTG